MFDITPTGSFYRLSLAGEAHRFEFPDGAIQPRLNPDINVFGCGLVLDPENKVAIFFTVNGILKGELVLEFSGITKGNLMYITNLTSTNCNYIMA
jgi:hypothetical protein